jgi:hypothetical protein
MRKANAAKCRHWGECKLSCRYFASKLLNRSHTHRPAFRRPVVSAADHVTPCYRRFEAPWCVYLQGQAFLDSPEDDPSERRTLLARHSPTFYLTTIIGPFRSYSGGRMCGLPQYHKRADRKWQTTFVTSNNDPMFFSSKCALYLCHTILPLSDSRTISVFLAINPIASKVLLQWTNFLFYQYFYKR